MAKEVDLDGLGNLAVASHGLQFGNLRAASAIVVTGVPTPGQAWCLLAVTDGGTDRESIIYCLEKGYITRDDPIIWHGLVPLTGTNYLCIFGRSIIACRIKLMASVSIQ